MLRREMAAIGTGQVPDTGVTDHLRLSLSPTVFDGVAALLGEVEIFRPTTLQRAVDLAGERAGLSAELGVRVGAVDLLGGSGGRDIGLVLESVVSIRLDTADARIDFTTTTHRTVVSGLLEFIDTEDGPALMISLAEATDLELGLDLENVPGDAAPLVESVVRELLRESIAEAETPVPMLVWDRFELGGAELELAASSLHLSPDDGGVTLGVVTALRPSGPGPDEVGGAPSPGGYRLDVHPDLARAALVQLAATGRIPRRFDDQGAPSLSGAHARTVGALRLDASRVSFSFEDWAIEGNRCGTKTLIGGGPIVVSEGRVSVDGEQMAVVGGGDLPESGYAGFAEDLSRTVGALLGPPALRLRAGMELRLYAEEVMADPAGASVLGTARIEARSLL